MKRVMMFLFIFAALRPAFADNSFWYEVMGEEARRILVPGEPPLTVGKQNVFLNCMEFGLGLALTQAEQEAVRAGLMQEFLTYKGKLLDDLTTMEKLWKEIASTDQDKRGALRLIIRDVLLEKMKKNPESMISHAISDVMKHREEVIPGLPRIDKRCIASFLELVQMSLRLRDRRVVSWSTTETAALEAALLKRIPTLSPEGRKWLENADFHRAIIDRSWHRIAADEKETVKALLIETFAPASASGTEPVIDIEKIPLPPPNIFALPSDLPWELR
ncbi:MAG: hypothetical protein HQM09_20175 [Candidatus Riflebacteria bacterium]|nr:hypothetical protein [Candidatus Riflebacteria bacterium]